LAIGLGQVAGGGIIPITCTRAPGMANPLQDRALHSGVIHVAGAHVQPPLPSEGHAASIVDDDPGSGLHAVQGQDVVSVGLQVQLETCKK